MNTHDTQDAGGEQSLDQYLRAAYARPAPFERHLSAFAYAGGLTPDELLLQAYEGGVALSQVERDAGEFWTHKVN